MADGADQKGTTAVDDQRRAALIAMARVMTYVPPAVATFAMGGLTVREAHAYVTNLPG
jgi:hypothetical protein